MPDSQHNNNGTTEGPLTVHLLEIGDLIEITDVDDGEVLDTVGDACGNLAGAKKGTRGRLTIEDFVLAHAIRIPITTEADDDQALVLGHNRLVDVPASDCHRISKIIPLLLSRSRGGEEQAPKAYVDSCHKSQAELPQGALSKLV